MSEITNFQNTPLNVNIEANRKFAYCTCGHSDTFPSCDGSHRTYGGKPIKLTLEKDQKLTLCRCGESKNLPHCDGSHLSHKNSNA